MRRSARDASASAERAFSSVVGPVSAAWRERGAPAAASGLLDDRTSLVTPPFALPEPEPDPPPTSEASTSRGARPSSRGLDGFDRPPTEKQ